MSYEVRLRRAAQKGLDALPERDYEMVAKVIGGLEENPRPLKVKKLADSGLWRIRAGQYRVIYAIDDEAQLLTIVRVARRKEDTYKGRMSTGQANGAGAGDVPQPAGQSGYRELSLRGGGNKGVAEGVLCRNRGRYVWS